MEAQQPNPQNSQCHHARVTIPLHPTATAKILPLALVAAGLQPARINDITEELTGNLPRTASCCPHQLRQWEGRYLGLTSPPVHCQVMLPFESVGRSSMVVFDSTFVL